jgi:DNA (cytosine-5)-methyltransferase 1
MVKKSPTVIDLFSGCGGASLGFLLQGFTLAAAVDNDEAACKTYSTNLGLEPLLEDIDATSAKEILKSADLKSGEPTVVIGCPPCQGFTRLRKRKFDRRNRLIYNYVNLVEELKPEFVLFENVPGILKVARGTYFEWVCNSLYEMGYGYVTSVLDAVNYGVPQFRKRVILLATRLKPCFPFLRLPMWTHSSPTHSRGLRLDTWVTVRDAIGRLPPVRVSQDHSSLSNNETGIHGALVLKRIRDIPKNGGSRSDMHRRLWLECHSPSKTDVGFRDVYGRLRWNRPAGTITSGCTNPTKGRFIHPTQNRALTAREAARLQSFPDRLRPLTGYERDFVFEGNRHEVSSQIGNALPPLLSSSLANTILDIASHNNSPSTSF